MSASIPKFNMADISRRRYQRVRMSVPVEVEGEKVHTMDWAVGGFRLSQPLRVLGDDRRAVAEMDIPAEGLVVHFALAIERVHASPDQTYAGYRFVDVGEEQNDLLRALVVSSVTGGGYPLDAILRVSVARQAVIEARASGRSLHPRLGFSIIRVD